MAEVRAQYRVINPQSIEDLAAQTNRNLALLADRLDAQEGRRGTPVFKADVDLDGNRARNAASAQDITDLTPLGQVSNTVTAAIASILQYNKPIGTIHITINPANPATYLGYGTWVTFGSGKVLVGLNSSDTDFDTVEETGGAKAVTLGDHNHSIPSHVHEAGTQVDNNLDLSTVQVNDGTVAAGISGAAGAANISTVQPYIVVYMWKRIA